MATVSVPFFTCVEMGTESFGLLRKRLEANFLGIKLVVSAPEFFGAVGGFLRGRSAERGDRAVVQERRPQPDAIEGHVDVTAVGAVRPVKAVEFPRGSPWRSRCSARRPHRSTGGGVADRCRLGDVATLPVRAPPNAWHSAHFWEKMGRPLSALSASNGKGYCRRRGQLDKGTNALHARQVDRSCKWRRRRSPS